MKTVTVSYQVFSFDELEQSAKDKAVNDEIASWLDFFTDEKNMPKNMLKAVRKAEQMQTPWFTGAYIWEYCKEEVLAYCDTYDYLKDGSVFNAEADKVQS